MTEKERLDTISVVMVEIIGHCDAGASDDEPVKLSLGTLLRWYDQLDACLESPAHHPITKETAQ